MVLPNHAPLWLESEANVQSLRRFFDEKPALLDRTVTISAARSYVFPGKVVGQDSNPVMNVQLLGPGCHGLAVLGLTMLLWYNKVSEEHG